MQRFIIFTGMFIKNLGNMHFRSIHEDSKNKVVEKCEQIVIQLIVNKKRTLFYFFSFMIWN